MAVPDASRYTRITSCKRCRGDILQIAHPIEMSYVVLAFAALGAIVIGGLLVAMHLKHRYHPNLIGALIGALLCFLLIEALPALT